MAALRLAAGVPRVLGALKQILPQSAEEWALRMGPEAGFAVLGAAMAPEGTPLGDRLALAAEDLLIGTGSSFVGSGLGRLGGGMLYPSGTANRAEKLAQAMTAGDILAAPLPMVAPRPIATAVYERTMEGQSKREQEQALQQEEERLFQEALANAVLTGGGALLAPGGASLLS